jgi:4-aminobutyrate--pyruvate transaminase
MASGSATQLPIVHKGFDLPLPQFLVTRAPHYLSGQIDASETEDQFVDRILGELEEMILQHGADTIAAFIAEPIQGSGGVVIPPETYFPKLQALLRKHEILLLADEIITGFGRTGSVFGCQLYGVQPDIMTVAKALSSGYQPIGAVILSEDIYEVMADASAINYVIGQGFTSSGHPVACAVALATLNIYEEDGLYDRVNELSPHFVGGLQDIAADPAVRELRAQGLVAGLELEPQGQPAGRMAAIFAEKAAARGLIVRPLGDTVALCPPLIISDDEVTGLHAMMQGALDDTKRAVAA